MSSTFCVALSPIASAQITETNTVCGPRGTNRLRFLSSNPPADIATTNSVASVTSSWRVVSLADSIFASPHRIPLAQSDVRGLKTLSLDGLRLWAAELPCRSELRHHRQHCRCNPTLIARRPAKRTRGAGLSLPPHGFQSPQGTLGVRDSASDGHSCESLHVPLIRPSVVAVDTRGFFDNAPPLAARHVDRHRDLVHPAPAGDVPRQLAPALHATARQPREGAPRGVGT